MVVDGVNIEALSNEEIFSRLQALGATCGPITESTRKIYLKKLMLLMSENEVDAPQNNGDADLDEEEDYSDDEEPIERMKTRSLTKTEASTSQNTSKSSPEVHKHVTERVEPDERRKTDSTTGADIFTLQYTNEDSPKGHRHVTETKEPVERRKTRSLTKTEAYTLQYTSEDSPDVHELVTETVVAESPESIGVTFDPEHQIPAPRRSLRSVKSSGEAIQARKAINKRSSAKDMSSEQLFAEGKDEVVNEANISSDMVVEGVDIETLSDEELVSRLQSLGVSYCPIVESTRKKYQNKLLMLMSGDAGDIPQYNGDVDLDEEEEYSDNEEPVEQSKSLSSTRADVAGSSNSSKITTTTTTYTSQHTNAGSPEIHRQVTETTVAASPEFSNITPVQERRTPSFRRSLRTVNSSPTETTTVRKVINNGSRIPIIASSQSSSLLGKTQPNVQTRSSLLFEYPNVFESEVHTKPVSSEKTSPEVNKAVVNKESKKLASTSSNMVVEGIDIEALSDEELFSVLQSLGATCGPIDEFTRKNYQKKLLMLMTGEIEEVVASPQYKRHVHLHEKEECPVIEEPFVCTKMWTCGTKVSGSPISSESTTSTTTYTSQYTSSGSPEVDRQVVSSLESSGDTFDQERYIPSARKPLRSATSSPNETFTTRKDINNGNRISSAFSPLKPLLGEQTQSNFQKESRFMSERSNVLESEASPKLVSLEQTAPGVKEAELYEGVSSSDMVVDGVDIEALSDEQLFSILKALGKTCGPIDESTREFYKKKLFVLMGGDVVDDPQYNGDGDLDEEMEYSYNEEPAGQRKTWSSTVADVADSPNSLKRTTTTTTYTSQYTNAGLPEVRRRVTETKVASSPESSGVIYDSEHHTHMPRRSPRNHTSSSNESITTRKVIHNGNSAKLVSQEQTSAEIKEDIETEESSKVALICRLLFKLILLALLIIAFLYIYQLFQKNSSENPPKSLEELAKQALEAATGQEFEAGYGIMPPAAAPPAPAAPVVAPPAAAPPAFAPPVAAPPPAFPPGVPPAPTGILQ